MPIFGALVASLFGGIWTAIQTYLIAKLAMRVIAVGILYAAWHSVRDLVDASLGGLVGAIPPMLQIPLTWILPPQMGTIIATVITVQSGLVAYRWAKILFGVRTSA